jgi:hypothetical protein
MSALTLSLLAPAGFAAPRGPDEWDRRVQRYVRFVERTRGLEFDHPVRVRFLDEDAFRKAAASGYEDVPDDDQEAAVLEAADLLAFGLVTERFDALGAAEAADVAGTTGWYDQETEELTIRGTRLGDTEVRLTIVHELTHALQDQAFDLDALDARATRGGASTALSALVEGDASRIELEYLWSLPQQVQDAYWNGIDVDEPTTPGAAPSELPGPESPSTASWPLVFDLWDSLDYDFAPTALDVVIAAHGREGIDALFAAPPRTEEAIIDPAALERGGAARPVKLPAFGLGEQPRGRADDWGAYSWYLVLASRIPWADALTAVEGWGGDRYRSYVETVDGTERACVRAAVTGDTGRDTDELQSAITEWGAAMPEGAVRVSRDGSVVVVSACPTEIVPSSPDDALQVAYDRLWERTDAMWYLTTRDSPPNELGRCIADALVADPDTQPLLALGDDVTKAQQRVVTDTMQRAATRCDERSDS